MNSASIDPHITPPLTQGVLGRRCLALLIDVGVIALIYLFLAVFLGVFGLLTFGLGWGGFLVMPAVPFLYHFATLANFGGTPGQRVMGLRVRRIADLGRPEWHQALISTVGFYLTVATSGILLLVALVTEGHRTLHDLVSGLIVLRDGGGGRFGSGYFPS